MVVPNHVHEENMDDDQVLYMNQPVCGCSWSSPSHLSFLVFFNSILSSSAVRPDDLEAFIPMAPAIISVGIIFPLSTRLTGTLTNPFGMSDLVSWTFAPSLEPGPCKQFPFASQKQKAVIHPEYVVDPLPFGRCSAQMPCQNRVTALLSGSRKVETNPSSTGPNIASHLCGSLPYFDR